GGDDVAAVLLTAVREVEAVPAPPVVDLHPGMACLREFLAGTGGEVAADVSGSEAALAQQAEREVREVLADTSTDRDEVGRSCGDIGGAHLELEAAAEELEEPA